MESRKSYGYGYYGSSKKGYEFRIVFDNYLNATVQTLQSGTVYPTEEQAIKAGKKYLKDRGQTGTVTAIRNTGRRFGY